MGWPRQPRQPVSHGLANSIETEGADNGGSIGAKATGGF
jgi:hypothetical protein